MKENKEYTIQQLSRLAGVSTRTLRYYDQIGLLPPLRVTPASYRMYGQEQVDLLQQILLYRELGMELKEIAAIIHAPSFHRLCALDTHLEKLLQKQQALAAMIYTVRQTIAAEKGEIVMTNAEKFQCFKQEKIDQNEKQYGGEIRQKYGEAAVEKSNEKFLSLSQEEYACMEDLGRQILHLLEQAVKEKQSPSSPVGLHIAQLHKQWLAFTWPKYTKEAHAGLAQMYTADPRFTAYYDKACPGCAQFLCDAIMAFTQQ